MKPDYQKRGLRYEPWNLAALPGETQDELDERRNFAYFEWQLNEVVPDWWAKFPPLNLSGADVLDLGCGHGALVVDIARRGAAHIVGVDTDSKRIDFARRHVRDHYPELAQKIEFFDRDIAAINGSFDFVISKDTFEHIQDINSVMQHIHRMLKPGGKFVVGFGPLYFSPFGDHGLYWGRRFLPWLPVYIPEPILLKIRRWRTGVSSANVADVGLNKLTPSQFRHVLSPKLWRVESLTYNEGNKLLLKPMNILRNIPFLERFFTTTIYAIISKNSDLISTLGNFLE